MSGNTLKYTLRFFSLLDLISLVFLSVQIYAIILNFSGIPTETLSRIKILLLVLIFPMLLVSAIGLFMQKKYGAIAYYIQFPIRLAIWVFSFGFLTYLSEFSNNPQVFEWLFRLTIILEFFRLYFTIQIHRRYL